MVPLTASERFVKVNVISSAEGRFKATDKVSNPLSSLPATRGRPNTALSSLPATRGRPNTVGISTSHVYVLLFSIDSPYQYAARFQDDGYIALPKAVFPRSAPNSPETLELEINTSSSEGLILWQGVEPKGRKVHAIKKEVGEHGKGKDFISLGLQDGHLVFSFQLGSGEAVIRSQRSINDERWHKITAVRTGKNGFIQIDGGAELHGQSKGRSLMVNTKGSLYLGGAPNMAAMTGGKFLSGIRGCVRNLSVMNATNIDLQTYAGVNVQPCAS
ncbi:hypothetical protein CesoFtcFv8_012043 [Champsocephalus esox]|uniref:Laminin G domain-containing protein n=1 Tax=Champsocephalus esox TaxID=159716 RepID=A0AAN8C1A2_9TELE|nr:hypothetical protein CesoFtcFv8_012043 [Champsocephalus esox]